MTYDSLFVDSDILLDLILNREPFAQYTKLLMVESNYHINFKLNTSALIIANMHYIIAKKLTKVDTLNSIKYIANRVNILSFENENILAAIKSDITDFEDAIQDSIAQKNQCDAIISRNVKHYKKSQLPVMTAEQFLRSL